MRNLLSKLKITSLLLNLSLFISTLFFLSCGPDEQPPLPTSKTSYTIEELDQDEDGENESREITGVIDENFTFTKNFQWVLTGKVIVSNEVVLTVEAGTLIKGRTGIAENATALIIARGGKINAVGTATLPIIFTSITDNITPEMVANGMFASPNLTVKDDGQWGGVIILGKAKISADDESQQIEGIPVSDANGLYGGMDDTDNSGKLQYVSIRHGGANIGEGNEINGLTLGGVGSGTTIDHIEVVANQDDGIEWFGGTVNVSYALVWGAGDDAIDTDQAWAGTLNNFVIINPGDEAFELDGPEGSYEGRGHHITNGSVSVQDAQGLVDFDDNTDATMNNIFFTDIRLKISNDNDVTYQDIEGYGPHTERKRSTEKAKEHVGYVANTNNFECSNFQVLIPSESVLSDYFKEYTDNLDISFFTQKNDHDSTTVGITDLDEFNFTFAKAAKVLDTFN